MNDLNNSNEKNSFEVAEFIKSVWIYRKLVIKITIVFFMIGLIIALISPIMYTSQTTFVPQTADNSIANSNSIGSLASLAGINLSSANSSSLDKYISPLLYSKIIESEEFTLSLIEEKLILSDINSIKIKDYILQDLNTFSIIGFIKKYTIGFLIGDKNDNILSNEILKEYGFISDEDYRIILAFKKKFLIQLNEKDGFIKVIATDKNPFISTQIVKLVTKNLQSRIISLRTNKIKEQLDYSLEQYEQKKIEFESLQIKLAKFIDSNKNISTAVFSSERKKLESEYALQENILTGLANIYNQNKIKLNKNTPIFSVLDEASVPNQKSKPMRTLIVFIFSILGMVISISFILLKEPLLEIIKNLKEK